VWKKQRAKSMTAETATLGPVNLVHFQCPPAVFIGCFRTSRCGWKSGFKKMIRHDGWGLTRDEKPGKWLIKLIK
jgi:hypothetical protein